MTILVTGGTGFIGGHLVRQLVERGERVRALVRQETDASGLSGVEIARGDVRDEQAVDRAVEGCVLVFHLAGLTTRSRPSPRTLNAVNVAGTENVARAAARAGVPRLVLASSTSVYGLRSRNVVIREDMLPRPESPYGRSKAHAESIARRVGGETGLSVVTARITSTLGPGSKAWHGLFGDVAEGRLRFVGRAKNCQHWADVSDIVDGLVCCGRTFETRGRTYNLAGRDPMTLRRIISMIVVAMGGPEPQRSWLPESALTMYGWANRVAMGITGRELPRHDRIEFFLADRRYDVSRARDELGFVPRVPLEESIRRTAEFVVGNRGLAEPASTPKGGG